TLAGLSSGVRESHSKVAAPELAWYMRNQLLRDADWAGMAHSVEVRVPLVDVSLFRSIAPWLVSRNHPTKLDALSVLRLPSDELEKIACRPKSGFMVPVQDWAKGSAAQGPTSVRGLRGWARTVLRRQSGRPLRVLVS